MSKSFTKVFFKFYRTMARIFKSALQTVTLWFDTARMWLRFYFSSRFTALDADLCGSAIYLRKTKRAVGKQIRSAAANGLAEISGELIGASTDNMLEVLQYFTGKQYTVTWSESSAGGVVFTISW